MDFNRAEEIFLIFLNKLDEELLNELIKNTDSFAPAGIKMVKKFTVVINKKTKPYSYRMYGFVYT